MPVFQTLTFAIYLCFACISIGACTYHNPQILDPLAGLGSGCGSEEVSFDSEIEAVLTKNCGSCHQGGRSDGGVSLNDYESVLLAVDNGSLMGSIEYEPGYKPMPPSGEALSDCEMLMLWGWVDAGAPE